MNHTWEELYTRAVHAFDGQHPTAELEREVVAHFQRHPAEVATAIDKTADRFAKRKIHSPWPIVRSELRYADERRTITADDTTERDQAIRLAETWIKNAGLNCPDPAEVLDALLGDHGPLKAWALDHELRDHLEQVWRSEQPRAHANHQAFLDRAHRNAASYHGARQSEPDDLPL